MEFETVNMRQRSDITRFVTDGALGVELGVAEGTFSLALLQTYKFSHLWSVDMWSGDRGHGTKEYMTTLQKLKDFRETNTCIRAKFDEAIVLFPDHFFDFIYVDGYAHTGQEGGATLKDWYQKLKPGGVFAGDDFTTRFPLVVDSVSAFAAELGRPLKVLKFLDRADAYSRHPSWLVEKI